MLLPDVLSGLVGLAAEERAGTAATVRRMAAKQYVALLRGINVGGRNPVAMARLRAAFEAEGYDRVSTYIQTGNVLFESEAPSRSLEAELEAMLQRQLGLTLVVVVRSHRQLRTIVGAPEYKQMTVRSWTTTIKLLSLLEPRGAG